MENRAMKRVESPQQGTSAQVQPRMESGEGANNGERKRQKNENVEGNQRVINDLPNVDTLPEDVWKDIFDLLDCLDRVSCLQAHSKWRHWLKDQRTLLLFPKVLALIRKRVEREDLLGLRRVCKKWKDDFDNTSWPSHSTRSIKFRFPVKIDMFLEEMNPNYGNPFPERCVTLEYKLINIPLRDEIAREEFWDQRELLKREYWGKVNDLLDKFGKHVWNVYIFPFELRDDEDDEEVIFTVEECVRNCLIRMPQLKRLTVNCGDSPDDGESEMIRSFFNTNSLPTLPDLEEVAMSPGVPNAVVDAILESCCIPEAVKELDLGNGIHDTLYTFQNLVVLEAEVYLEDLERLQILNPPLRKFITKVQSKTGDGPIDFERLFSTLNQFGRTLTHVEIKGIPVLRMSAVNTFRIQLPKLEYLQLKEYDGPFDPFIVLKKLAYLTVLNDEVESRSMQGSLMEFEGFEKRIKESNIWTLLPSLHWFEYKVTNLNGSFQHKSIQYR